LRADPPQQQQHRDVTSAADGVWWVASSEVGNWVFACWRPSAAPAGIS
jgi:hypothetical protein